MLLRTLQKILLLKHKMFSLLTKFEMLFFYLTELRLESKSSDWNLQEPALHWWDHFAYKDTLERSTHVENP